MRILLVEDNPDLADAIVRRMRRSGHAVDWQSDGLAAASVLRYQSFDLVVLDIGLPKLDGLRVLAGMREQVVGKDEIGNGLFGFDDEAGPNAIELYVGRLRRKLADAPLRIVTVRGSGYLLEAHDATPDGSRPDGG